MKEKLKAWAFDWRYIFLAFGTSFGIMLLIAFCYDMLPFGDITILRMDLYHQYGPLLAELYDRLTNAESLAYSWTSGGGGSFIGNFFNYLSSPLSLFILLFGHKNTTDCIAFIITMKAALSASTMTYYFKKSPEFKVSNFFTAGFGILYAFSGYFVAYYWNFMWLDGMMLLPLIVLGIEKIFNGEKGFLYLFSLALLMFSSYYMAYMCCIFSVLYALMYIAARAKIGKDLIKQIIKFAAFSLLAAGLAAVALLPTYYCLKTCSATSDSFPTEISTYFNIFDFLCQHLAGLEPTIRSSGDDVLPNIYCGIITVICALLYLYMGSVPLREKISKFILLLILALSIDINYLNNIWHAFHFPNDLPYRWSYCYSFILITIGARALLNIKELKAREILNVSIGLALFIIIAEEVGSKNLKIETVIISLCFVIAYTIMLKILSDKKFQSTAMAGLMFCLMFAEIAVANTDNYDIDQPKTDYAGDYGDFKVIKGKLDAIEGDNFYRMELTDLRTRMDNSWYGYNGLSVFSSMAYEKSANLQSNLGMFSNYINSYTYNLQTPVYNAMFGLKYIVNNSYAIDLSERFYKPISTVDKFTAYENLYDLPLGFCVPKRIKNWNTTNANPFIVQNEYWKLSTGLDNVFKQVPITNCLYYNLDEFDDVESGSYIFYKQIDDQSASFTLTVTPKAAENIYIYVKSSNVETVTMRDDSDDWIKSQTVDEPYIFDLGVHEPGENIYIDVPINEGSSGYVDVYVYSLDEKVFKEGYKTLSANPFEVSKVTDTKICGSVKADSDCTLYTSINYDKSWNIYVDGKKVNDKDIIPIGESLIGINITKGSHDITLKYNPQGVKLGATISIFSLLIIIAIILITKKVLPKKEHLKFLSY